MTLRRTATVAALLILALSACGPKRGAENGGVPGDADSSKVFSGIAPNETVHFVGTEPFWGGTVQGTALTYTTPENQPGAHIDVKRFAGRHGLGFSGTLESQVFDMTITPGTCSDGMSDRSFPFTTTLKLGEEVREGCAWTDAQPFSEATTKP